MENKKPLSLYLLVFFLLLAGIGGLGGGLALILSPDGSLLKMPLSLLSEGPFEDFFFPGMVLFSLIGVYPILVAAGLLWKPNWQFFERLNLYKGIRHWSWAHSLYFGISLTLWIATELILINGFHYLQSIYLYWAVIILMLTLMPKVEAYCSAEGRQGYFMRRNG